MEEWNADKANHDIDHHLKITNRGSKNEKNIYIRTNGNRAVGSCGL